MDDGDSMQMGFVQKRLHWVIAAVFLAVYLVTLNRWVTVGSISSVFKILGWDWAPQFSNPLVYLVSLPIRSIPEAMQPLALNALGAVMGALTLSHLARSIALLPHDRTRDQRQRERSDYSLLSVSTAWLPPLLGCLLCGLGMTFWEESTAFTGEILSVLLFAYVVRCLLEFRLFQEDRWLYKLSLVYGFAVPCDWAFIGYFPLVVGALVWTKGTAFFNPTFLIRMTVTGVIGLFTYLLLPVLITMQDLGIGSFVELMKLQLGHQRTMLMGVPKTVFLLLSLTSLLPVVVMGIRFPSSIGDVSVVGSMLSNFMFRLMHVLFFGACIWVAFDPAFSPRNVKGLLPVSFLTFYYLGALAVGYYAGYLMLVFGMNQGHSRRRRNNPILNVLMTGVLWLAGTLAPLGLIIKNLPHIRTTNGGQFATFAEKLVSNLPDGRAMVLADDAFSVQVVQAELKRQRLDRDYTIVDLGSLGLSLYHDRLYAEVSSKWESAFEDGAIPKQINIVTMLNVLAGIVKENPVYYLNSSFGLYFEVFYPRQKGLVTQLMPYEEKSLKPPSLSEAEIGVNQSFWSDLVSALPDLSSGVRALDPASLYLGSWASRELNVWGVMLQQEGRLADAKASFEQAKRWNPENTCVDVNLRQNEVLSSGAVLQAVGLNEQESKSVQQAYGTFEQLLLANGPIDAAEFRLLLAAEFTRGGNHRQAMLNYQRAIELDPQNLQAKLTAVGSYLNSGFPEFVPSLIAEIKEAHTDLDKSAQSELIRLEALGHFGLGNQADGQGDADVREASFKRAEEILTEAIAAEPDNAAFLETLSQFYLFTGRNEEALSLLDRQLLLNPDDTRVLQNKGLAHVRVKQFREAIPPLTEVVNAEPDNNYARLNRAISYYQLDDHENAKSDYLLVNETVFDHPAVYFGLGKIAAAAGETLVAIENYERYLVVAQNRTSEEFQSITAELKQLKGE